MVSAEVVELIEREIDGENTPQESARLKELVRVNSEVHMLLTEMSAVAHALSSVGQVHPPPSLKPAILRSVHAKRIHVPTRRQVSMAERLLGVFSPASAVRYALASAVGLVTGVLLFAWWTHSISGSAVGDADISGTMLSNESLNALPMGTRLEVQRELVQGWVATGQSGDISLLRMDLSAEEPIRAVVWFPSQDVGIAGTRLHEPLDGSMTLGNGEVTVVAKGHSSATLFFFRRVSEPTRVRITIASAGAIIYERELTLGE